MGFLYEYQLIIWIVVSMAVYALVSNFAWLYRRPRSRYLGNIVARIRHSPHRLWIERSALFLYYVGVPYAALIYGVVDARSMGIAYLDWRRGAFWALGIGGAGSVLLAAAWGLYARRVITSGVDIELFPLIGEIRILGQPLGWANILLAVIYREAHWTFYRSVGLWGGYNAVVGAVIGIVLVLAEWIANPAWRNRAGFARGGFTLCLLILTGAVFALTRNLWLCVITHSLAELVVLLLLQRMYNFFAKKGTNHRDTETQSF